MLAQIKYASYPPQKFLISFGSCKKNMASIGNSCFSLGVADI